MRVLLVEDDALLAAGISTVLAASEHTVIHTPTGELATEALLANDYDLVVLDLGLPDIDGLALLDPLRQHHPSTPVMVLTARGGVGEKVTALGAGADDFLEKPFDLRAFEARIRALTRRRGSDRSPDIHLGSVALNRRHCTLSIDGHVEHLPRREYELLELLVLNVGTIMSKPLLAQRLKGSDQRVGNSTVEVYIHRLRRRLMPTDLRIRAVRGFGYIIDEPVAP